MVFLMIILPIAVLIVYVVVDAHIAGIEFNIFVVFSVSCAVDTVIWRFGENSANVAYNH